VIEGATSVLKSVYTALAFVLVHTQLRNHESTQPVKRAIYVIYSICDIEIGIL